MKPISIQLYSVREEAKEDFPGVLKKIADFGYKGVEPAGLHGYAPAEIRRIVDDLGMVVSSAHMPLVTSENINETVDIAGALGFDMVISGKDSPEFETLGTIKAAATAFQTGAELLKPHGLRMGYHNHWWEMHEIDGQLALETFLELAPDVFSELDTYWACNFGAVDVPALLARQAARCPILHIKDGPLVQDQPHTAVGAGKMDFASVIAAADESVLEWVVVELDQCATDMLTAVNESCQYLTASGLGEGSA